MRKTIQRIRDALYAGNKLRVTSTYTDGKSVWYHDNKIIETREDGVYFSLAGWNTVTTRERINGIAFKGFNCFGVYVSKGVVYLDGQQIDIHDWHKVCNLDARIHEFYDQIA